MKKKLIISILLSIMSCYLASGTNYYVSSSSGSDNSDGTSPGTPWKSISKINRKRFLPGDSILFKKGDVWRETLTLNSSGTIDKYIVFSSYGSGSLPKILGSAEIKQWDNQSDNIWRSKNTVSDPEAGRYPGTTFFKKADGTVKWGNMQKSGIEDLAVEYDWIYRANYIYIYSPADPNTRYDGVEVAQRLFGIELNNKEYITIDGLEIQFFCRAGTGENYPTSNVSGLIIKNCQMSYMGIRGGDGSGIFASHSNMLIQNNIIHDSGRRNIDINIYGSNFTVRNITVENNTLFNGYHTTGIDISSSGMANNFDSIILRRNIIYDSAYADLNAPAGFYYHTAGIWVQNYGYGGTYVKNIFIYSNIFKNSQKDRIEFANIQGAYIINNTFYGSHQLLRDNVYQIKFTYGCTNMVMKNNIFYGNTNYLIIQNAPLVYVSSNSDEHEIDADYNLYYQDDARTPIISVNSERNNYRMSDWSIMKKSLGWETHSPDPSDPMFVSESDFHLQPGSPAMGKGIAFKDIKTDFEGKLYGNPPNIGCYATPLSEGIPAYINSSVASVDPFLVTMKYNMNLADIVPAKSAFKIKVNNVAVDISTVSISGNEVQLTLTGTVDYGDIVAVSYTKPKYNPLQSITGVDAESFLDHIAPYDVALSEPPVPATEQ